MHTPSNPPVVPPVTFLSTPEAAPEARKTRRRQRKPPRKAVESWAKREIRWFFERWEGRVPEEGCAPPEVIAAACAIERWLGAIVTYHRGALSLRYTPRRWPPVLALKYREHTSLVVRLECALIPWDGKSADEKLEARGVERLIEHTRSRRRDPIYSALRARAREHVREAIQAYVAVRGTGPCVLPAETSSEEGEAAQ